MTPTFPAPGVYTDIAEAEYRKHGVHISQLKEMEKSPAHYRHKLLHPDPQTRPQYLGTVLHADVLGAGKDYQPPFYKPAGLDLRSKEGREWKASIGDTPWVTDEEADNIAAATDAIREHPLASQALIGDRYEVVVANDYMIAGQTLTKVGRIDIVAPPDAKTLWDIKTVQGADKDDLERTIARFKYHWQAAYYLDLWNELNPDDQKTEFGLIAVELEPPYGVTVNVLHQDAVAEGRKKYLTMLGRLAVCIGDNEWPGYHPYVRVVNLPRYEYQRTEAEVYQ